ncbi:Hypothetical protein A7982_00818 [Minicystis rosea]|nr:Hypothetical protein A7982_00818 [Minicystis rosea]
MGMARDPESDERLPAPAHELAIQLEAQPPNRARLTESP